nr:MAG TPA: hypothetical protein [Caudoviricetes sp.]
MFIFQNQVFSLRFQMLVIPDTATEIQEFCQNRQNSIPAIRSTLIAGIT